VPVSITDIEDGLQSFSAVDAGCTSVITYDKRDWKFSQLPVFAPDHFLLEHLFGK